MELINEKNKEFYIKRIEKYKKEIKNSNKRIIIYVFGTGLNALFLVSALMTSEPTLVSEAGGLIGFTGVIGYPIATTHIIAEKMGIKVRVKEIEKFFEFHGLNLKNEIVKAKGK